MSPFPTDALAVSKGRFARKEALSRPLWPLSGPGLHPASGQMGLETVITASAHCHGLLGGAK